MRAFTDLTTYAGGMLSTYSSQASVPRPGKVVALTCCTLRCGGAPLYEILSAGEWRSPAFMSYMDLHQLERDVVIQAHVDDSESEGEQ